MVCSNSFFLNLDLHDCVSSLQYSLVKENPCYLVHREGQRKEIEMRENERPTDGVMERQTQIKDLQLISITTLINVVISQPVIILIKTFH